MNPSENNIRPYFKIHTKEIPPLKREGCRWCIDYERPGETRLFYIGFSSINPETNELVFRVAIDSYSNVIHEIKYNLPSEEESRLHTNTIYNTDFSFTDKYLYKESAATLAVDVAMFAVRESLREVRNNGGKSDLYLEKNISTETYNDALVIWIDENKEAAIYYFYEPKMGIITDKNLYILALVLYDFKREYVTMTQEDEEVYEFAMKEIAYQESLKNKANTPKKTNFTWLLIIIILFIFLRKW